VNVASARYQVPVTKYRHIVFAAKISAVIFVAVGLEFFVTRQFLLAVVTILLGLAVSLWPVRVDVAPDPPEVRKKDKSDQAAGKAIHPLEEL
jgi:hypothetical protein